ncbi:HAD family hydrolase [Candidatus Bathyarchaeota archaeon]|nr:MAG: HAD family hydrolase [Candidatus Bathyarchaeota archaeon]
MSPRKVDGVVFDLDATLVNLGGFVDWRKAHDEIVDNYIALDCDPSTVRECSAKGLFNMLELMYQYLREEKGAMKADEIQGSAYEILGNYERIGVDSCTLMDGCVDVLDWLREKGTPLGICTSNSLRSAEAALELQGIREYFKVVIGRTVDVPMKPDPTQLRMCFDQLNVNPENGVMVGDSHKDVIAGKKLGAYTVGIPVHFTRLDLMKGAGVDVIIDNLSELKAVIESL